MRQTLLICRRGLGRMFRSPLAYVIICLFLLCTGFFFFYITRHRATALDYFRGDAPAAVCRQLWEITGWVLLFVAPIISMGSIAEEKSRGTIELLLTSPLRPVHLIVGKYLALLLFLVVMLAPTGVYFLFLRRFGGPGYGQIFAGYLGAFLLGAAVLALGVAVSALTENQVIAAFGTFGAALIFSFIDAAGMSFRGIWRNAVRHLSIHLHYAHVVGGDVGLDDVVYLLSFAAFFLFAAHLSIRILWVKGRWGS